MRERREIPGTMELERGIEKVVIRAILRLDRNDPGFIGRDLSSKRNEEIIERVVNEILSEDSAIILDPQLKLAVIKNACKRIKETLFKAHLMDVLDIPEDAAEHVIRDVNSTGVAPNEDDDGLI